MHTSSRLLSQSVPISSIVSSPSSQSVSSEKASSRVPVRGFEGHKHCVRCACFYPHDNKLVTGSEDGTLRIWDQETGAVDVLRGHTGGVWEVDVSRDGKMIVSGGSDETARIWNGETGERMHTLKGHNGGVLSVGFSPDSTRVVSGTGDYIDHTVQVWSVETGELALEPIKCRSLAWCVRYSPNGERIASGGGSIQIWSAHTGTGIVSIRNSEVHGLAWTPDSTYVIGGGVGKVTMWNSHNGEPLRTWKAHNDRIRRLSLSPNGTYFATCGWLDKTALVFDTSTGERVAALRHTGNVYGVAYSFSGQFIATACVDQKVCLWEAPVVEDLQNKSPLPPFSSFLDRPAIPGWLSRNDGRRLDEFWDSLLNVRFSVGLVAARRCPQQSERHVHRLRHCMGSQCYSFQLRP
ncbi:WD40 repeat-like protein [Paxillus ammoniavirescens]|nr:WD40 repeat-like protein [Paxillus ammoniavirescens]